VTDRWQGHLYHKAVLRKVKDGGGVRGLCWVPCLFESETSSSTSLGAVSWHGAKGKQKNETCGAQWTWVACGRRAVKRCIGAKETREGAEMPQQKETIAGSGSLLTHTDVLHGGSNTAFTSSRAVLVDLAPGVQCVQTAPQRSTARLGCQVAHRVGGASRLCELSQAALTRWH
jgi:hypothetical protein